jgi:hypothetical protein
MPAFIESMVSSGQILSIDQRFAQGGPDYVPVYRAHEDCSKSAQNALSGPTRPPGACQAHNVSSGTPGTLSGAQRVRQGGGVFIEVDAPNMTAQCRTAMYGFQGFSTAIGFSTVRAQLWGFGWVFGVLR